MAKSNAKIKGFIKNIETGEIRQFQLNPNTFKYGRSTTFNETSSPASPYPQISYAYGDSSTFTVPLYMHGAVKDSGLTSSINSFIKFLDGFMTQPDTSGFVEKNPKPKLLLFCYGTFIKKCLLKSYDYEHLTMSVDGLPYTTNINITLLEVGGVTITSITRPDTTEVPTILIRDPVTGEYTRDTPKQPIDVSVFYSSHCENLGWLPEVSNGEDSGTTGEGLRLEAVKFRLEKGDLDLQLVGNCHIQNIGWGLENAEEGVVCGTVGDALRLEALKFWLVGEDAPKYSIYYRIHVENLGWMAWKKDGDPVGSAGFSLRGEAIQMTIAPIGYEVTQ